LKDVEHNLIYTTFFCCVSGVSLRDLLYKYLRYYLENQLKKRLC